MNRIKTTDVWLDTGKTNPEPIYAGGVQIHMALEKFTGMIVLTVEQFNKAIADAKAEELKRIRDSDREIDEWCNKLKN